ncbi:hypothetical protein OPQ81_002262 [Rhizoctonia solani]|nr:hypothetical protein OPQ81_002262 [Rhizoctonia solani]
MLSSALLSLGVAGSALAWPGLGHPRHSSIARALHSRQEPVATKPKDPVAATWFASWHADEFSLANVSWNKYTTVSYSFAVTTPNISFVNISDPDVFKDFVSTAHANNVSATISIGGWTGSLYFSSAVATAENRTEFVKTMVNLLQDNNLDGLSFDWEYPGAAGIGCNTNSPNDTDNFLLFLKELRTALPSNATLSAATSITPFISAEGTPSTNVSEFASVFDYIQIMNYDVWGPWSETTGPNAPLNDTCATNATQKVGSAVSAIEAWTKAGFPVDQLVLGVAGYGHGFSVAPTNALSDGILNPYSTFNKSFTPPGDAWDDAPVNGTVDVCGNPQAQGGNWNFWGLIEGGFLNENGTANTAEGIVYKYDECSQTPFVYNQTSGVLVAFDNAASFTAKGQFINATGLRGFALWEAGGDFDDILLDAIRSGAGFPEVDEDDGDCEDDETGTTIPQTGNTSNNSGSNNSGNNSGNTSGDNSSNTSNNSGSNNSGNNNSGSNNSGSNSSNNSGSNHSSNSSSNNSSNSGNTSTTPSNNNGSNNSGSNNSGSSNTTPDYGDDDDCEDDEYNEPTTTPSSTASAKPTATAAATSEDDDECEDDEYPEPAISTTANPTTYQVPTATAPTTTSTAVAQPSITPEATLPDVDDDGEECEDDETIIDVTTSVASATAPATSSVVTSTVSATHSEVTVISTASASSSASESSYTLSAASTLVTESAATATSTFAVTSAATSAAPITEAASTVVPTASVTESTVPTTTAVTESYEPSSPVATVEPATSGVPSSSIAEPTSSEPVTIPQPSSSFEPSTSAEPSTSQAPSSPLSEAPAPTAAPTSTSVSFSSEAPTVSTPEPTFR